jgi:hypothetical protein
LIYLKHDHILEHINNQYGVSKMAAKLRKTCSFRMLSTPEVKSDLFRLADKLGLSGADYIAALIAADVEGRVRWNSKSKTTRNAV